MKEMIMFTKRTKKAAALCLAVIAMMLMSAIPARASLVFANAAAPQAFSPKNYYYGNYEKGEPTRAAKSLPYSYGFENNSLSSEGWTGTNLNGSSGIVNTSGYIYDGSYAFQFYYVSSSNQYLISPELATSSKSIYVEFYYRVRSSGYAETFEVGYSSGGNSTSDFTFQNISGVATSVTTTAESYTKYSVTFPAGTKYIAIHHTSNNKWLLFIDNILIEEESSCAKPTGLTYSNVTSNSVDLNWTSSESKWDIRYKTSAGSWTTEYDVTKPYTLSELTASTNYEVQVRADCGGDDGPSNWTSSVSFKTDCGAISLATPYEDGFEDGIDCWDMVSCHSSTGVTSTNHSGSKGFIFYYNSAPPQYLISPEFSGASGGMIVEFYYKVGSSYQTETFQVGYSTTNKATSSFTWGTEFSTTSTSWTKYSSESDFSSKGIPAGAKYIAIKYNSDDKYYLYLDDFTFTAIPSSTTYTVTYNGNGGTGTMTDSNTYADGATVTVLSNTFTAPSGKAFASWNSKADGSGSTFGTSFTITQDTTLYAQWANVYTVTYQGNGNTSGTAPTDSNSPYTSGSTVTVLGNTGTLAKTGYRFTGWNTSSTGTGGTHYDAGATFSISANTTLYAEWKELFNITLTTPTGGSLSTEPAAGSDVAIAGETVTVTAEPSSGYTLTALIYNDGSDHSINIASTPYTFTMPASNVTVTATFTAADYTVSLGSLSNGTATLNTSTAHAGDEITVTVHPAIGYTTTAISTTPATTITGTLGATNTFTFTMPAANTTVNVTFGTGGSGGECQGISEDSNTTSQEYGPFDGYTKYNCYQILYPGSTLPTTINSFAFKYAGTTSISQTMSVYFAETSNSSQSTYLNQSAYTLVYSGTMAFDANVNNWVTFELNQNGGSFTHDQSKNLVVLVLDNSGTYGSSGAHNFYYATSSNTVTCYNNSDSDPDSGDKYHFSASGVLSTGTGYYESTISPSTTKNYPIARFCETGSSGSSDFHTITCTPSSESPSNGCYVSTNAATAAVGTYITVTPTIASGYQLNTLTVATTAKTNYVVTDNGNGTYEFTMPAANVTVTATFSSSSGGDTWTDAVTSKPAGYVVSGSSKEITISSEEGLAWLAKRVNGMDGAGSIISLGDTTVTITRDLDMSDHIWVPIGYDDSSPYSGTFNGYYHTISGLHISDATEIDDVETAMLTYPLKYVGLFGYTSGATIKNTFVADGTLSCKESTGDIGGLVGYATGNTKVEMCGSSLTVKALGANLNAMGGLVGCLYNSSYSPNSYVKGCFATGTVDYGTYETWYVGGVAGMLYGAAFQDCFANCAITGSGTVNKKGAVAGNTTLFDNGYAHLGATGAAKVADCSTAYNYYAPTGGGYSPVTGTYSPVTAYTYGSYATNNTVTISTTTKPLADWLNDNVAAGFKWVLPKGTGINGGYPIVVRTDDDAPIACMKDGKNIVFGNVNDLLATASASDTVFMYGSGAITLSTAPAGKLYIDEDAALTQDNNIAITATVGITIDNTAGNGEESRDWHAFSSALTAASIGINYGAQNCTYGADDFVLGAVGSEGTGFSLTQNNPEVYFPDGITTANGCDGTEFDLYAYSEPNYHWVNMKRKTGNHFYEDTHEAFSYTNESTYTPGHGYFLAIGDNSTAKYTLLQATGTLNNGDVGPISVTYSGAHLPGYNLLGNPYQSYLDFNAFASTNGSALWGDGTGVMGYKAYLIYDAERGGFDEYLVDAGGSSFSQGSLQTASRYIHPHQGFFVVKKEGDPRDVYFYNTMRVTSNSSAYRDEQPSYPLINLICTDSEGKQEVSVIEFNRPSVAGSLKMKGMLNSKGNLYIRYNDEDFGSMFLSDTPKMLPLWFRALEDGVFTLSWSTANGEFNNLHLIDNLTGADIDCNAAQSYTFESRQTDSKARFRLVFAPYGIDEQETVEGESFAFISNGELIVTGNGELSLIDLNGRILATERVSGEQSRIAMPNVAEGMYLLRLTNTNGTKMQKIVIRR